MLKDSMECSTTDSFLICWAECLIVLREQKKVFSFLLPLIYILFNLFLIYILVHLFSDLYFISSFSCKIY